jgi:hypothetical protein
MSSEWERERKEIDHPGICIDARPIPASCLSLEANNYQACCVIALAIIALFMRRCLIGIRLIDVAVWDSRPPPLLSPIKRKYINSNRWIVQFRVHTRARYSIKISRLENCWRVGVLNLIREGKRHRCPLEVRGLYNCARIVMLINCHAVQ